MLNIKMDPKQWGPDTWTFLHILSFKSQASHKTLYNFFYNLKHLLPCPVCRKNYDQHFNSIDFPKYKKDIPLWLIRIHNRVNISAQQSVEDEIAMFNYWKQRSAQVRNTKEIGIWTFIQCAIHTHPGKYKISIDQIHAHQFIWKFIDAIIPKYLQDYSEVIHYLKLHPFNDIITKGVYHTQAHVFFEEFDLIKSISQEKQLCKSYCVKDTPSISLI